MKIKLHPNFEKSYKRRIASNNKLSKKVKERLDLFKNDPTNPVLKDHLLQGKKIGLRAFSVTGDVRIVYYLDGNVVYLLDIGTHNQVY